ncbi:AI-2E family transporter [Pontibacter ruber]|uniref:AI-2E family transporter n=1 Tax=Pontibacter ruber TaxID=1343895 RepID=A0ABW5CTY6_9BACT|nr:AI-2E family transporter [Pontibacter ruber]
MKSISIYRASAILLFGILLVIALYYGRIFFIPLGFAALLSMLMTPVSRKLEQWGIGRGVATLLCILIFMLFLAAIAAVIAAQLVSFSEDLPQIQKKLEQLLDTLQQWIQHKYGASPQQQITFVREQISSLSQSANKYFTTVLSGTLGLVSAFVLVVLYMFFLMWKREKFEEFTLRLVSPENRPEAQQVVNEIKQVAAQYLVGRLMSMLFLAIFYSIGLSVLGLKNAVLVSIIAVLPTIIPYVGAFVGAVFPLIVAMISGSPSMVLPTFAILVAAQVIDNNIIEPLVMGSKLNLSPIFTIIAIVLGEMIWGIPGMILFEPLFAVVRIVSQHVQKLHPYGFLLQNEVEDPKWVDKLKGLFGKG